MVCLHTLVVANNSKNYLGVLSEEDICACNGYSYDLEGWEDTLGNGDVTVIFTID